MEKLARWAVLIVVLILGSAFFVGGGSLADKQSAIDVCRFVAERDLDHPLLPCMRGKGYEMFTQGQYCVRGDVPDKVFDPHCYETRMQTFMRQIGLTRETKWHSSEMSVKETLNKSLSTWLRIDR